MKKSETSSQSASGKKSSDCRRRRIRYDGSDHGSKKWGKVVILEHKDRIGKKYYQQETEDAIYQYVADTGMLPLYGFGISVESSFTVSCSDTIAFFQKLGIYSKNRNGYLYPYSDQASAVLDALRLELESLKVEIQTETEVMEIRPVKHGFTIRPPKEKYQQIA